MSNTQTHDGEGSLDGFIYDGYQILDADGGVLVNRTWPNHPLTHDGKPVLVTAANFDDHRGLFPKHVIDVLRTILVHRKKTTPRVLNIREAVNLATIIGWTQGNKRLVWLDDRNETQTGTARSIGDAAGNFLNLDDDVRDGFLRITTSMGFEWFVPISDVLARHSAGTMMEDSR